MVSLNVRCIHCSEFYPGHQNSNRIPGFKTDTGCEVGACNRCVRKLEKEEQRRKLKVIDGGVKDGN